VVGGTSFDLTPEDAHQTADGGYILLGLTQAPQSSNGVGVSWLLKTDASGNARWQEELGCFGTPPGDYSDGVSEQQTGDGGYIVGGGTIGCGSGSICPPSSGIQCALIEKLDPMGKVSWAEVVAGGADGSAITQIKQTTDGGYIAAGNATDASQNTGALALKLDSHGTVQWQRQLGPTGHTQAYFNAIQQTADGGYVAAGELATTNAGTSALAVKFDSGGDVQWQQAFNNLNGSGVPTSALHTMSVVQTTDGGYVVGGNWTNSTLPGQCCAGTLLLKLQSDGSLQWQNAYSGGVYCFFNGFNETCTNIGGLIYSVHQTSDGGYALAGAGDLELTDSTPLVPWMAKVDASGTLTWQHFYYESNASTGRPVSEYFASSTLTRGGGVMGIGFTEDSTTLKGDLFAVRADNLGLAGSCSDVRSATPLSVVNPALVSFLPALTIQTSISASVPAPSTVMSTAVKTLARC
jgi:hypothetical protein